MFRMNGHDFSSRQIISSYIHVGNVVMPRMAMNDDGNERRCSEWPLSYLVYSNTLLLVDIKNFPRSYFHLFFVIFLLALLLHFLL
jgi:hypothetical protein